MDVRLVWNYNYGSESSVALHALECKFEVCIHVGEGEDCIGSQIDQGSTCCKCWICGYLQD